MVDDFKSNLLVEKKKKSGCGFIFENLDNFDNKLEIFHQTFEITKLSNIV
jgi:hypothetical protein